MIYSVVRVGENKGVSEVTSLIPAVGVHVKEFDVGGISTRTLSPLQIVLSFIVIKFVLIFLTLCSLFAPPVDAVKPQKTIGSPLNISFTISPV